MKEKKERTLGLQDNYRELSISLSQNDILESFEWEFNM